MKNISMLNPAKSLGYISSATAWADSDQLKAVAILPDSIDATDKQDLKYIGNQKKAKFL